MQSWILSGLAAIFLINAICLIFMGNFTERAGGNARYKSHEFDKNPIAFSCSVGLLLVLGFTCLHFGQPHLYPVLLKKVPQLAFINTILKMKNGLYYFIGGSFVAATFLAFIFRQSITSATTFSKGHELDLQPGAVKRHEAKIRAETPDWKRDGDHKASTQFDDGTPL